MSAKTMDGHTYKLVEVVGSSAKSAEDAVCGALAKASESVRNMRWFEVVETRGSIASGAVEHWQVTLKVGFTLEE